MGWKPGDPPEFWEPGDPIYERPINEMFDHECVKCGATWSSTARVYICLSCDEVRCVVSTRRIQIQSRRPQVVD